MYPVRPQFSASASVQIRPDQYQDTLLRSFPLRRAAEKTPSHSVCPSLIPAGEETGPNFLLNLSDPVGQDLLLDVRKQRQEAPTNWQR
jgi:hypothetical protein